MFGLDMVLIHKALYCCAAYGALYTAIPVFFDGKNKSATSGKIENLGKLKGKDGFILGKNKHGKTLQLSYKYTLQGISGMAPTGEGKTTALIENQLLNNSLPKSSFAGVDMKGEIYDHTAEFQKSIGRTPMLFEPLGSGKIRYNPLDFCTNSTEVRQLAMNLLTNGSLGVRLEAGSGGLTGSDSTWINMSAPLFVASLIYHKSLGRPYDNIPAAVRFLINTDAEKITDTFADCKINAVRENYNIFSMSVGSSEDGKSDNGPLTSILTTLATNLALFLDPKLEKNICESDFTPQMLRDQPIALYIKYDPMKANYLAPFVSVFFSQLLAKLMAYHTVDTLPVFVILDEYQNLGKISNMVQVASLCRYVDIPLSIFVQSLSRLYQIYGRDETASILNNLKIKIALPSISEIDTLRYISDLCGFEEIEVNDNGRKSRIKKKLFEYDEVRRIDDEKCIIVGHNLKPIVCTQYKYFDDTDMLLNRYL